MRVAIVGSRTYPDLAEVREFVAGLPQGTLVISGHGRGVDMAAEDAANERFRRGELPKPLIFPADWDRHGKAAGCLRNTKIVEAVAAEAERAVTAFWDGRSPGTADTIRKARRAGVLVLLRKRNNDRAETRILHPY